MAKYAKTSHETDTVFSKEWGLGKVISRPNDHCIRVDFSGKWRELDYKYYNAKGKLDYVVPAREAYTAYLKKRKAQYLTHFTPIANLESIMADGICPRDQQEKAGIWTDNQRLDGHVDCSCFSISYPNYSMLYQKRCSMGMNKLAVLLIDIDALAAINEKNVAFYQVNAADSSCRNDAFDTHTGVRALKSMFAESIPYTSVPVIRSRQNLGSKYTTNPQAEILIRSIVPTKYIKKIILFDDTSRLLLPTAIPSQIEISSNPSMFWPQDGKWSDYISRKGRSSNGYSSGLWIA